MIKKATKYDDLIALLLTFLLAPIIGNGILGLYIDLDNIFLSSSLVCIFIILSFAFLDYLLRY
ncbi:hypothetical protein [Oceanobacillus saliphilus]|uniref:hypothetical protein n=1 Tax=Oceanobacillus saliphilus TaxID=2925834 RepID=UPI00201DB04A|nr:hypothetical protein [Oceanobacillus saliphilus]